MFWFLFWFFRFPNARSAEATTQQKHARSLEARPKEKMKATREEQG